jgi:predicted permease
VPITRLDVRLALRRPCRTPAVSAAAVLLLAVSLGGTIFVFSSVRALLFHAIPYEDPGRLVVLSPQGMRGGNLFAELQEQRGVFEDLGAYTERAANVSGEGPSERVLIARVTPRFLSMTGATPSRGRLFSADDFSIGRDPVVVITDELWRRRYGARDDVVGRTVMLDRRSYTVIGVLPPSFRTVRQMEVARELPLDRDVAVLVPLPGNVHSYDPTGSDRVFRGVTILGRLRKHVSVEQANRALAPILEREARRVGFTLSSGSGPSTWHRPFVLQPLASAVAGGLPAQLAILSTAVILLLVVGLANVTNLMLGRIEVRRRDMAVSAAIGASTRRIVGSILGETLLVAVGGGALGLLLAAEAQTAMKLLAGGVLDLTAVRTDLSVVVFAAAASVVTGLFVGVAPALRHARTDPAAALQSSVRRTSGQLPLSSVLVVTQVALAVVLVVTGALVARAFIRTVTVDTGFAPDGILTAEVALDRSASWQRHGTSGYFSQLLEHVTTLPGVAAAALSGPVPGGEFDGAMPVRVRGRAYFVDATHVSAGYFSLLSIPLVAGTVWTDADAASRSVVVNEAFARETLGGPAKAVGQRITLVVPVPRTPQTPAVAEPELTVVGVVADSRDNALASAPRPKIYQSYRQRSSSTTMTILVRTSIGHPAALASSLIQRMRAFDSSQPLYNVLPLTDIIHFRFARERAMTAVMNTFAIISLLVAALGVYAAMSYAGALRRHEVGVRLALGGTRAAVLRPLAWRGIKLVSTGLEFGLLLAVTSVSVLRTSLFGMDGLDVPTVAAAVALVTFTSAVALFVPAWRATAVDPMETLRTE